MAEESGLFTSIGEDRKYTAAFMNERLHEALQRSDGVIREKDGELKVDPTAGLSVTVATGVAIKAGFFYRNGTTITIEIPEPELGYSRIDYITVRIDRYRRTMKVERVAGTASTDTPLPPSLSSEDDIALALVLANRHPGPTVLTVTDAREFRPKFLTDQDSIDELPDGDDYGRIQKARATAINQGIFGTTLKPFIFVKKLWSGSSSYLKAAARVEGKNLLMALSTYTNKIFYSNDEGTDWTERTGLNSADTPVSIIAFPVTVPYGGVAFIVGAIARIFRSVDYGATWTQALYDESSEYFDSFCVVNENNVLASGRNSRKIFRSTDRGITWSLLATLPIADDGLASMEYLGGSVIIGGGFGYSKIWRSTDLGATWTCVHTNGESGTSCVRMVKGLGDGVVLAGYEESNIVMRSTDYGITWTAAATLSGVMPCKYALVDGEACYLGANSIYRSLDKGLTWHLAQTMLTNAAILSLSKGPKGNYVALSEYGHVYWACPLQV
jgi:photosystem II stability/assembly factor-like uncharacterized protein